MTNRPFSPVFGCLDVAQALLPAASALMPTLACDPVSRPPTGVETSLDGLVGRTPRSARDALVPLFARRIKHLRHCGRPTRASAADQGIRPTICAEWSRVSKLSGLWARGVPNRFGGGGPQYAANPGLTPSFRRSLPETGCLSQGLPHGKRDAWPCPPKPLSTRARVPAPQAARKES